MVGIKNEINGLTHGEIFEYPLVGGGFDTF